MIDIKTGTVTINDKLIIPKGYTFNNFKESPYFDNQNEERVIELGAIGNVLDDKVFVGLIFRNSMISMIFLMIAFPEIKGFEDEPKRKALHDKYLKSIGLKPVNKFDWGTINSNFDSKGCSSDIIISYKY